MHRFFLNPEDTISAKSVTISNSVLIHQLSKVLRFKPNQNIILINSANSSELEVRLDEFSKSKITASIIKINTTNPESALKLNLHFPILKNTDKTEMIIQKCTEIGVTEFTPLISARTEKKHLPKTERLLKIITEACEQSGRISIPKLNEPTKFLTEINPKHINLIADPFSTNKLTQKFTPNMPINLYIGPEGGFTQDEVKMAISQKFQTFNLGTLILRAETACIVASSKILI